MLGHRSGVAGSNYGLGEKARLHLVGRVAGRLVAPVGLTSALPDQGAIGAFLHGRFLKLLCSQAVGRSTPLAGQLGVRIVAAIVMLLFKILYTTIDL